jgi:hypothetical protein
VLRFGVDGGSLALFSMEGCERGLFFFDLSELGI